MAKIFSFSCENNFSNPSTIGVQANGVDSTNATHPFGVPGALYVTSDRVMRSFLSLSQPETALSHRSEIALVPNNREEVWYTWEMMIPSSYVYTGYITCMQIHDSPDGGDPVSYPNFILGLTGGNLITRLPAAVLPTESISFVEMSRVPFIRNKWYKFCLHVNWQINNTGAREFFIDRVPMFRQFSTPSAYDTVLGPYFKMGCYAQEGGTYPDLELYYKNLNIWTGGNDYTTVMGGMPLPTANQVPK